MKVNYNSILRAYESSLESINELCSEESIAMEASAEDMATGTADNGSGETNSDQSVTATPAQKNKIIEFIKKILDKIRGFIDMAKRHISNKMKLMMTTDRGFARQLERAKGRNKPMKGFKAIVYVYDNSYLERTMSNVMQKLLSETNKIQALNFKDVSVEIPTGDEVISKVLEGVSSGKENLTIQAFSREMIDKFRGEKKEILFNQSQLPVLERTVTQGASKSAFADYVGQIDRANQNLESKKAQLSSANSSEEISRVTRAMSAISQCYSASTTLCKIYYELKVEQYLSAREVVRQFYQF